MVVHPKKICVFSSCSSRAESNPQNPYIDPWQLVAFTIPYDLRMLWKLCNFLLRQHNHQNTSSTIDKKIACCSWFRFFCNSFLGKKFFFWSPKRCNDWNIKTVGKYSSKQLCGNPSSSSSSITLTTNRTHRDSIRSLWFLLLFIRILHALFILNSVLPFSKQCIMGTIIILKRNEKNTSQRERFLLPILVVLCALALAYLGRLHDLVASNGIGGATPSQCAWASHIP